MEEIFIEELFHAEPQKSLKRRESGSVITTDEVKKSISLIKERKPPGRDKINGVLLKILGNNNNQQLNNLYNRIYNTGKILTDWLKSTFIIIPNLKHAKYRNNNVRMQKQVNQSNSSVLKLL